MNDLDDLFGFDDPAAPPPNEPEGLAVPPERAAESGPIPAPLEKTDQAALFEGEGWEDDWRGMPAFVQRDLTPWKSLLVHFESPEHLRAFAELVAQTVHATTKMIWYPAAEIGRFADKRWIDASLNARVLRRPERPRGDP